MARVKKVSLFGVVEGDREQLLINHLVQIYKPRENNINPNFKHSSGGTPDSIINIAFKECSRERVFVWFDEDFEIDYPISEEVKLILAKHWNIDPNEEFLKCPLSEIHKFNVKNRKPILIVSQPICVEALILICLGEKLPFTLLDGKNRTNQIKSLKDKVKKLIAQSKMTEEEFYVKFLTKDIIETSRAHCEQIDLLVSILS